MKAISPMIAVILLIAFTVAIGGILSVWLSGLVSTQTSTVSSGSDKQIKCSSVALTIKTVTFNQTNACAVCNTTYYVNTTVRYDSGTEVLSPNVTLEVIYKGAINSSIGIITLSPGQSFANSTNVTRQNATGYYNSESVTPEIVRARTYCQGSVAVVAECKSGQPCMSPYS